MIVVPEEYTIQKFFQFCGAPKHNRHNKTYQGSCPVCREGNSWLKKRRCYFVPKNNNIFCHNCGLSKTPLAWIQLVSRMTFQEIRQEIEHLDTSVETASTEVLPTIVAEALPHDSINILDANQVEYYCNNTIIQRALDFIQQRNLNIAINRPDAFYVSLTDKTHKNRLIVPFCDANRKVIHYQSRTILQADMHTRPRYMSKRGSEKTLFNFDKINSNLDKIFVFEGPLNACFCVNGVAVAGIQDDSTKNFTNKQQDQINQYPFCDKIWVLDSQWRDKAALNKSKILASMGEKVFIWPEKLGRKCKDFNDVSIAFNINQISPQFIEANTHQGLVAEIKLRTIK